MVSNVTVIALPNITVNSGTTCSGKSFTIIPNGGITYTYSSGSAVVSPLTNTNYTVTGTSSVGCVSLPATLNVSVFALPIINVNTGTICAGTSFTLIPNGAITYTYSSGSSVVSPTSTTSYSVIGTNSLGCVSTVSAVATITVGAIPTISVNSGSICLGKSFTINASGASSYVYSGGSAIVSPTTNSTYSITGTSSLGCVSATPGISTVTILQSPTISVNSGTICSGNNFTFIPNGALTYTYSSNSVTVSPLADTNYSVTGTNSLGCVSVNTAVSSVSVVALPIISVNSGSVCAGNVFTMNPNGAISYSYSNGSSTVIPLSSTSYSVVGTASSGCVSLPVISSVTVHALPTLSVNSGSVCLGDVFTMLPSGAFTYTFSNSSSTVIPTTNTVYTIIGTNTLGCISAPIQSSVTVNSIPTIAVNSGSICSGNIFTINPTGAFTYTISGNSNTVNPTTNSSYTITGVDAFGCLASNTVISNVTVFSLPNISINGSSLICEGDLAAISASGAVNYTWSSGALTSSVSVSPNITTTYSLTAEDSNGCINYGLHTVSVNPSPSITVNSGVICFGDSYVINPSGAVTYTFSSGSATVSPTVNTSYSVTGKDSNGCISLIPAIASVSVVSSLTVTVSGSVAVCNGESTTLTANGATSYNWDLGVTTNTISLNPNVSTNYTVIGFNGSCSDTAYVTLTIYPNPTVTIIPSNTIICVGETATLNANGAANYVWNDGATNMALPVNPTVNTTYTVTGSDLNGCFNSTSFVLNVSDCIGLNENNTLKNNFSIFPNPNIGSFIVKIDGFNDNTSLEITTIEGKLTQLYTINATNNEFKITNLSKGIYFCKIFYNGNSIGVKKLIVTD